MTNVLSPSAIVEARLGPVQGKLLGLEALDSFLLRQTAEACKQVRLALEITSEPGNSSIHAEILGLQSSGDWKEFRALTKVKYFSTGRSHHLDIEILPCLREGKNVLSLRLDGTTYAMQVYPEGDEELSRYFRADREMTFRGIVRPITYIFLDEDPTHAHQRKVVDAIGHGMDVAMVPSIETLEVYREGYLAFIQLHSGVVIDRDEERNMIERAVEEIRRRIA